MIGSKKDDSNFSVFGCDPSGGQAPPVASGDALTATCVAGGGSKPVRRAPHVRSLVIQLPRHYDSYTFTNTTGAPQCVTVDTDTDCTGTNFIFIAAYLGSFDPNNICTNWIGDSGFSPDVGAPQAFSFNVNDGDTFVVVVSEVTPEAGCPAYTMTITPESICGGGGSPTPTPTASPTCSPGRSRSVDCRQPIPAKRCALWLCPDCHPLVCFRWSRRRHSYDHCEPYEPRDGNVGTASAHAVRE